MQESRKEGFQMADKYGNNHNRWKNGWANMVNLSYEGKKSKQEVIEGTPLLPLTHVRPYGQEWWSGWHNLLVIGDNLLALKSFASNSEVRGKVRLIYVDPPFATNQEFRAGKERTSTISRSDKDQVAYADTKTGTEYLESVRERLFLAKELMADDGSIYLHIDTKIGHYVKVIMDEVFGQQHFINDIARIKSNPKNFEREGGGYGNQRDMVLFYAKGDHPVWNGAFKKYTKRQVEELFPKVDKEGRRYTTNPLHAPGETRNGATGGVWKVRGKELRPPKGRHWRYHPEVLEELEGKGLIEWSSTGNPRKVIYADDFIKKKTKVQDIWKFKDPLYPCYPTEKNLSMLKMIVKASSNPGDLVMDFYCGSGSTLVAAEEDGRKWIGVDNSQVAIEASLKRLLSIKKVSPFIVSRVGETPLSEALEKLVQ